ncbi:hypothetical protein sos41_41630 [Alphaproteobacteria bacterium SO-S41]|nr:hypothetical protein sos41_41630 [Alphaproteobacteria bacterium SO-S41]
MADVARRPRADALRNRERLIDAAKAAFGEVGPDVSLEEIARRTGVGIGTLYRHFPTRDAIIEAVYRREVDQLAAAARSLLAEVRPAEAFSRWLHLSLDYLATKRLIVPALGTLTGGASALYAHSGASLQEAIELLVGAGIAAGEIRPDVQASDLFPVFSGLAAGVSAPGWKESADRLIDIVMVGLARR